MSDSALLGVHLSGCGQRYRLIFVIGRVPYGIVVDE